ncbi:MAG: hypothetical protein IJX39_04705 [Clostridia bacterium]|nr:hypothetical protein [Clostridia bacterium]
MAYENFIPEIWKKKIEHDLERDCVYAEDCNRAYEGDVKQCGDTVHILGVGKPTISTLARESASGDITGPEEVEGTDTILVIDQIRYFNFMVGDIDKAQAVNGLLDSLTKEANEGLANEVDTYIAALVSGAGSTVTQADLTADNVLDALDAGQQKLYENDVKATTEVVVVIPPAVYTLFRRAYLQRDTNNHEALANGKVARYGNMTVKLSNNVNKSGSVYNCMMRTKRAVAYAQPVRHIEPYRPQGKFADAVKGFILFGAKVVRPKEMVKLALTIAA